MENLVFAAKAFADPSRVRILFALRDQELCVCELSGALGMTQSTLSTHLQVIRAAGLVSARKDGKWMYYAIAPEAKKLVQFLFQNFAAPLHSDKTLQRDEKKLLRRLAMRDNGSCCVGFKKSKASLASCS